jgi:hypothetical protein
MASGSKPDVIPIENRAILRRQLAQSREVVVEARIATDRSIAESKSLMAAADAAMALRPRRDEARVEGTT